MWNLVLYVVAVVVGLVLYYMYENEESVDECTHQLQAGNASASPVKAAVSDFRFSSLFAVLGFSVPGNTSEERFESFTEHFTTFDEVVLWPI